MGLGRGKPLTVTWSNGWPWSENLTTVSPTEVLAIVCKKKSFIWTRVDSLRAGPEGGWTLTEIRSRGATEPNLFCPTISVVSPAFAVTVSPLWTGGLAEKCRLDPGTRRPW
jgi:hypothetical protein